MRGREGLQRALKLLFKQDGWEKRRQEAKVNTRKTVATQAFQTRIRDRCAGGAKRNSVQRENALRKQTSGESRGFVRTEIFGQEMEIPASLPKRMRPLWSPLDFIWY